MKRGFTLIELFVVFIVLLVIVSVAGPMILAASTASVKPLAEKPPTRDSAVKTDGFVGFQKMMGAEMRVEIPAGFRLINVTWKDGNMWIFVQSEVDGHHEFIEKSNFGLIEAKVIFNK